MIIAAVQGAWRSAFDWLALAGGRPASRRSPDRRLLERGILPSLAGRADVRRVLFVGCAPYTRHYEAIFERAEYWTIDPVPRRRRWGGRRHIVGRLEGLGRHVPAAHFDLIVCNGVLGWGLDRRADAEAAFAACHAALRPGGALIVGWNDVRPHNRITPDRVRALAQFERFALRGLGGPQVRVHAPHRHVFEFYRKAGRTGADDAHADRVVGASGAGAQADSGRHAPSAHSS